MTDAADRTITWERTGGKTHRVVVTDRALADENRRHWELNQAILQAHAEAARRMFGQGIVNTTMQQTTYLGMIG